MLICCYVFCQSSYMNMYEEVGFVVIINCEFVIVDFDKVIGFITMMVFYDRAYDNAHVMILLFAFYVTFYYYFLIIKLYKPSHQQSSNTSSPALSQEHSLMILNQLKSI